MERHTSISNIVDNIIDDMIDEIEEEYIIAINAMHGFKVIVDFNFLRSCKLLKGATIFKRLFKLKKFNDIKCNLMKDKNGEISILKDLNIKSSEWNLLMGFLRTGYVKGYKNYLNSGDNRNTIIYHIETLMDLSNTFGGIPSIDLFYEEFFKTDKDLEVKYYNPINPKDDYLQIYDWVSFSDSPALPHETFWRHREDKQESWNFTQMNTVEASPHTKYYIYRKKKVNSDIFLNNSIIVHSNQHRYFLSTDEEAEAETDTETDIDSTSISSLSDN